MSYTDFYEKFEESRNKNKDFNNAVITVENKIDKLMLTMFFNKFLHLFCLNIKVDIKSSMSSEEMSLLMGYLNRKYIQYIAGDIFYIRKCLFSSKYRITTVFVPNVVIF